jgi:hypothetical protein
LEFVGNQEAMNDAMRRIRVKSNCASLTQGMTTLIDLKAESDDLEPQTRVRMLPSGVETQMKS